MKSSKMERFLPNECYVCKSRDNLTRCKCNMICYCSENHQLKHLPVHESFCKVIKELLIEKKVSHIFEELTNITGSLWVTKRSEINKEILKKLKRPMSPLENAMRKNPRVCFVCRQTRQEYLINCPDCPVASFCENHSQDVLHTMNCKVMSQFLKILNAAEELNVDLKFLSPTFPCITEEKENQLMDSLAVTYKVNKMEEKCLESRFLKIDLINFMDVASKINSALQKVRDTIPEVLTIHIDALFYIHAITKKNYWEFLLHLNPQIKKLKIVFTSSENGSNSKTSLCENCISEEKELIAEYSSETYEDYMLEEKYQEPDLLFYVQINLRSISERLNKWSEFNCPVILRFDTNSNFCKTEHFLSFLTAKFEFIYEGQIKAAFSTLSSIENKDYFIILQSKENKEKKVPQKSCKTAVEITEKNIDTTTEVLVDRNKNNESNKKQKSVDRETLSPSSSKRSFATISEPGDKEEGEKSKKSKTENCKNCSKSIDKENCGQNGEERKIAEKDDKLNCQSYLIEHISFLKNEIEGLRQQLNLSINEVTKQQTKLDQVSFDLNKKNKLINKILRDIVNATDTELKDTDSLCENGENNSI
ncbi:uncharacterized protein LOC122508673 isoform X1 [Leptopilina heterotoma]|uniref:uncharacterized protein LOC122508673 isoform X1 n=1 Tax=Leptopilina heterotoma TaxID=63436 RepID=UPI001CAA0565|nr:uncharacterized protein LOC122508673 isoform X1 [Leptopilina heterotoma]